MKISRSIIARDHRGTLHETCKCAHWLEYGIPAHCVIRRIGPADLKDALTKGANDFLPILEFLGQAALHCFVQHFLCDHLHILN